MDRLNREVNEIMARPDVRARLRALNMANPQQNTVAQFDRIFRDDLKIWRTMAEREGIVAVN